MTERLRSASTADYQCQNIKMDHSDLLSPRKSLLVLVIVVGCFAVLWPKVFYPMLVGSAEHHSKPSPIDKTTGCCDVISETDVNIIKLMSELCGTIIKTHEEENGRPLTGKEIVQRCRQEVLETCGIDISAVLQQQVRLGQNVKQIIDEVRSLNGSLCLKYNFGVAPWRLGVPHRVTVKMPSSNIRQERPLHLRSELIHPAFRERGRAIPQPQNAPPVRPAASRVIDGRPGPIPGMRPTMGGAGHVVPPPKQGTSSMSVIMPIYTIGIVIFFTYTLMKIIFKKQPEGVGGALYPPIEPDPQFRKEVFESEKARMAPRLSRENLSSKLGDAELDQLRQRLRETELAMERIVEQMAKVPLKSQDLLNGTISNGNAPKPQDDQSSVTVVGMEMTASCEGGKRWTRPDSPLLPSPSPPPSEPMPPPQEIFLEGTLPPESHLLVTDSAAKAESGAGEDPAVILAGKMTLSVVSLDSSDNGTSKSEIELESTSEEIVDTLREKVEVKREEPAVKPALEQALEEAAVEEQIEQILELEEQTPEEPAVGEQTPEELSLEEPVLEEPILAETKSKLTFAEAPVIEIESEHATLDSEAVLELEEEVDNVIQEALNNITQRNELLSDTIRSSSAADDNDDAKSNEAEVGSDEEIIEEYEEEEEVEYEEESEEESDQEDDKDPSNFTKTESSGPARLNGSSGLNDDSKFTSVSSATDAAENDVSEEEVTDEEVEDEEEIIEIEEVEEDEEDEEEIVEGSDANHILDESDDDN